MTQTQTQTREITIIQALNEAIREEMQRDERVFIMGEDIQSGVYGASGGLFAEFGGARRREIRLTLEITAPGPQFNPSAPLGAGWRRSRH